jgi:hypothetical protein
MYAKYLCNKFEISRCLSRQQNNLLVEFSKFRVKILVNLDNKQCTIIFILEKSLIQVM